MTVPILEEIRTEAHVKEMWQGEAADGAAPEMKRGGHGPSGQCGDSGLVGDAGSKWKMSPRVKSSRIHLRWILARAWLRDRASMWGILTWVL